MELIDVGVVLVVAYFGVTGMLFLLRPQAVSLYEIAPRGPAGRTEVRCYYGALALGIGGFLAYLGMRDLGREAIVGVLIIASAILVTRVVGAFVDDGWGERYTRTAVPVEVGFVVLLAGTLALG
jgi:hypothetical protein